MLRHGCSSKKAKGMHAKDATSMGIFKDIQYAIL
jgi:hypothetical protein